jgi:diguanylate cyclase (GGDEF)-like protein/PAS domain S-box-containing protein
MPKFVSDPFSAVAEKRSSAALAKASLVTFFGILGLVFVLAISLVVYFAHNLDRSERAQAQVLVEKSLEAAHLSLRLTVGDYAFWGDAYRYLHTTVDLNWAFVRENFGPTLFEDFGFQGLFVVGPANRTVYSVVDGRLEYVSATDWIGASIDELVRDARAHAEEEKAVTRLTVLKGVPALIAAAAITPGTDPTVEADEGPDSVMLVVKILDPLKLDELGQSLGIKGLRLDDPHDSAEPRLLLHGDQGQQIRLQWDRAQPGRQMLLVMLPLMGLAGLLILLMTWIVLRRNQMAARSLDASHELLKSSQAALASSEARFRDVAQACSDWIWEINAHGRLTYLSDRFESVTGLAKDQWLGAPMDALITLHSGAPLDWSGLAHDSAPPTIECRYIDAQQRERIARITARHLGALGFRGTATDVTEEIEARRRVEYLSRHDVLTGLPNRAQLRDYLDSRMAPGRDVIEQLVLLTIDLDRFKPVNDLLGHATGDRVLHHVAARVHQCIRSEDIVARVGGDEFVMVLAGALDHAAIEAICQRLIDAIEQVIVVDGQDIFVSASVGIALAPTDASQATELLRYSDIALYEAKASGRGTWRFYAGDMNERIIERRRLENDLRYAIKHDELRLHFQPRFRLGDGQMVGAEALVRWQHRERGLLAPDAFIAIAEETGLIASLGDWVLNAACRQAIEWPDTLFVSVNVSSKEFQVGQLVERVEAALRASGLAASRLELELTESVMVEDADNALQVMQALKSLGVRLSMDDFGTGYSSLSYLRLFPFDGLKIDRSFVNRLGESPADLAIVEAVVGLGRALSLTVTAEGIETCEHLRLLNSVACAEGQGYYLSRPVDEVKFGKLLGIEVSAAL